MSRDVGVRVLPESLRLIRQRKRRDVLLYDDSGPSGGMKYSESDDNLYSAVLSASSQKYWLR